MLLCCSITYINEHTYIKRRDLLTPINTNIIVKRALPPVAKSVKDFHIEANINSFTVSEFLTVELYALN